MADIFVSYKSERRRAAEHLTRILELHGYSVWFDYALLSGREFDREIERELRAARAVIVLWCSLSCESEWVLNEAHLAKDLEKLLPVWIQQVELPLAFRRMDTVDLSNWDGAPRSQALDRVFDQLAQLTGRDATQQRKGLIEYEKTWRRFGAPTLANFALEPVALSAEHLAPNACWTVQVNATRDMQEASALVAKLCAGGYEAYVVLGPVRGETWYRIRVGRFPSPEKAKEMEERLRRVDGLEAAYVTPQQTPESR